MRSTSKMFTNESKVWLNSSSDKTTSALLSAIFKTLYPNGALVFYLTGLPFEGVGSVTMPKDRVNDKLMGGNWCLRSRDSRCHIRGQLQKRVDTICRDKQT